MQHETPSGKPYQQVIWRQRSSCFESQGTEVIGSLRDGIRRCFRRKDVIGSANRMAAAEFVVPLVTDFHNLEEAWVFAELHKN